MFHFIDSSRLIHLSVFQLIFTSEFIVCLYHKYPFRYFFLIQTKIICTLFLLLNCELPWIFIFCETNQLQNNSSSFKKTATGSNHKAKSTQRIQPFKILITRKTLKYFSTFSVTNRKKSVSSHLSSKTYKQKKYCSCCCC